MKIALKTIALCLVLWTLPHAADAQSTAFTYNGRLNLNGVPVNGAHEMQFTLYDANAGGNVMAGPLPPISANVANGLFTVRIDFGAGVFVGPPRWLSVEVRPVGGVFSTLAPRQEVTSSPYSIRAQTAGSVADGTVAANQLNTAGVPPTPGQFLSFSGGNLVWSDPGLVAGNIWSLNGNRAYYNGGNVGIGTANPAAVLEANGIVRSTRLGQPDQYLQLDGGTSVSIRMTAQSIPSAEKSLIIRNLSGEATPGVNNTIQFALGTTAAPVTKMMIDKDGRVGIGSMTPQASLEVVGQDALRLVGYQPFLTLLDSDTGYARGRIQSYAGNIAFEPESFLNGSDPNSSVTLANSGDFSVKTLTIRGGADLAEPFEFSTGKISEGSVVIIDDEHPGKLKLSEHAYDTRVAGIVSGANGIKPGISLHQVGMLERGQNVALTGRVHVLADATSGAIKPGDLLTTSDTPGHAMKVSSTAKAQGAILGKAMTPLAGGRGTVLVLVTLQ